MVEQNHLQAFIETSSHSTTEERGVRCQVEDGVAVVIIDHEAARNALSLSMWAAIRDEFTALNHRSDIRAVVLRGAGDAAFAAGANISEFPTLRLTASDAARYNDVLGDALRAISETPVPTIAAIKGYAVGGGCELAAACDLRIGSSDAKIGIPIGRLGVILGVTETRLLIRHTGVNGLKRILFTGELFDAEESKSLGLLDEVVPAAELWARVATICKGILGSSVVTMSAAKTITDLAATLDGHAAERVHRFLVEAYDGPELREGVAAFLEKRTPDFEGARA